MTIFVPWHEMWEDGSKHAHAQTHTREEKKERLVQIKNRQILHSFSRLKTKLLVSQVVIFNKSKGADKWCQLPSRVLFRAVAPGLLTSSCCQCVWAHVCACLDLAILPIVQLCLVSQQLYLSLEIDWSPFALKQSENTSRGILILTSKNRFRGKRL